MKHPGLISKTSQVNVKRVITLSNSKGNDSATEIENLVFDGTDSESSKGRNGVGEADEGMGIDFDGSESGKESVIDGNLVNDCGNDFVSDNSVNTSVKDAKLSDCMPETPIPISENDILNPKPSVSKPKNTNKVSFGEVRMPVLRKENEGLGQSLSFANVVAKSSGGNGNNKLKFVPTVLNGEGREVPDMDPVIEDGCKKWSLTVFGHFVGYPNGL
ncbi:hypothetical protein Tco_0194100 [Tanacetum coccineum]